MTPCRQLVVVLGDQLNHDSAAFDGFDPSLDRIVMIEARDESTHVWSHKARTALFLSAMRHFAAELVAKGMVVEYRRLGEHNDVSLQAGWLAVLAAHSPACVVCVEPGDLRVWQALNEVATQADVALDIRADRHFMCSREAFATWAGDSKTLRMENFYRKMRREHQVLMQPGNPTEPLGGQWNFDGENRKSFGRRGPGFLPEIPRFEPDAITREVFALVEHEFSEHPGSLTQFNWPVTRDDALVALRSFVEDRLDAFGPYQDAMWTNMPFGWHSLLSTSLNLKLLSPREVIHAAEAALQARSLDLACVEGFIRQVLGWREFVRGVYFLDMPALKIDNHFKHSNALPTWYWTGNTQMNCLRECIGQTLEHGYAHHIQRLMITGMFGVIAEILPQSMCDWYLAVYVDAVEWVELPNTAGMALFANGGRFTSKPYIASGAYVKRMSNYCDGCRYQPEVKSGANACPMTTLYWHFLDKHERSFAANPRTALMVKNLARQSPDERAAIRVEAARMLSDLNAL
ncbi:MAG TPA: cryptochrome/photolyase family protein [Casimicrobium sp.]|nr:cryptochrome/photolyase family protein [Casimicrobium sp.]